MEKSNLRILFRSLLPAYLLTAALLLVLAFGLYRFQLTEEQVELGVKGIYLFVCFIAGIIAGKLGKTKKFLRGFFSGAGYYLILFLISFAVMQKPAASGQELLLSLLLCAASGMIGGMIS